MPTLTQRGKASVNGIAGTFDVILYPEPQTADATHNYEVVTVKDRNGQDCAKRARNEHVTTAFKCKLLGDTAAHAIVGAAFLAPLAIVTLSGFDISSWNGAYTVEPGEKTSLVNDNIGDFDFTLLAYVDATQRALMTTIPA